MASMIRVMTRQDVYLEQLSQDVQKKRVAILLGTGVTRAFTGDAPTADWKGLLRDGLQHFAEGPTERRAGGHLETLDDNPDTDDLITIAQWVFAKFGGSKSGEYRNWIRRTMHSLPRGKDPVLAAALPNVEYVLTTNYDDTWQDAYPDRKPIHWRKELAEVEYDRSPSEAVFHLHGHYEDSESIVLSGQDYGRLGNNGVSFSVLQRILTGNSLCLIGCGAGTNDPSLGQLISWLSSTQNTSPERHYLFLKDDEAAVFDNKRDFDSRLTPIAYGPDHSALGAFLDRVFGEPPSGPESGRAVDFEAKNANRSVVAHRSNENQKDADANHVLASLLGMEFLPEGFAAEVKRELGSLELLNTFQSNALYVGGRAASERTSALFCAVTGTGKTT